MTAQFERQLAAAARYKKTLRRSEGQYTGRAVRLFQDSVSGFLAKLRSVGKSSPGTLGQVDVGTLVAESTREAREQAAIQVRRAYQSGWDLGRTAAGEELQSLGVEFSLPDVSDSSFLNSLLGDLDRNFGRLEAEAAVRVRAIFEQDGGSGAAKVRAATDEVVRLAQELSSRAGLSAQVAANRAYTDAQVGTTTGSPVYKMWVANFVQSKPCLTCLALHGTVIPLSDDFDGSRSYAASPPQVYGALSGPPRHPNCRCRLVIVADQKAAESARMQEFTETFLADSLMKAGFTAKKIRSWSESFTAAFKSGLQRLFGRRSS